MISFLKNFMLVVCRTSSNLQTGNALESGPRICRLAAFVSTLVVTALVCSPAAAQGLTGPQELAGRVQLSAEISRPEGQGHSSRREAPDSLGSGAAETLALELTSMPPNPEIGQQVVFFLSNLSGAIDSADWSFGGPGCPGFTETATCTAGLFNLCTAMPYQYASGGPKDVSVTVHWTGGGQDGASTTLTVQYGGTCGGTMCTYAISPTSASFDSEGGDGGVSVTTQTGCTWTAVSDNPTWVAVTSGATGSGPGNVSYSVAANSGAARIGTMTIAGKTFTVNQAEPSCSYSVASSTTSFSFVGGIGSVSVTAQAGCTWTASDTASWITLQRGSGTGSGSFQFAVDPNTGSARSASIVVQGQSLQIAQAAAGEGMNILISNPSPEIGEVVVFKALGPSTAVSWDLGGPSCSSLSSTTGCWSNPGTCQEVTWRYSSAGTKAVTYTDQLGNQASKTLTVRPTGSCPTSCDATSAPTAAISVSPDPAVVGQAVTFSDASTGNPTEWNWAVVSGSLIVASSSQSTFTKVFESAGTYSVTLTSTNCLGSDTATKALTVLDEPAVTKLVIPGGAHTEGLLGTSWRTDLVVFNPWDDTMNLTVEPEGGSQASGAVPILAFGLEPGATRLLEDILGVPPLGDGASRKSSLVLQWEGDTFRPPAVAARTYNQTAEGSYGQYLPAVSSAAAGEEQWLTGLADNESYRTNLMLVNLAEDDASGVTVELLDADGSTIGTITDITIPAGESVQLVSLAGQAGVGTAVDLYSARVHADSANIAASASVIDNRSGDPVQYIGAHEGSGHAWLPGIAHLAGANGSLWRSDVALSNPSSSALSVTLEFIPETSIGFSPMLRVELNTGEAMRIGDIVGTLIGTDVSVKGFLDVSTDGETSGSPLIAARTFNLSESGTFGQAIPAFTGTSLIPTGSRGCMAGARTSATADHGYRTNIGLVNTAPASAAVVNIRLFNTTGLEVASYLGYSLPANSSTQFNQLVALGIGGIDMVGSVIIEVVSGGPVGAYLSVIDNRTQDPVLVPAVPCGAFAD